MKYEIGICHTVIVIVNCKFFLGKTAALTLLSTFAFFEGEWCVWASLCTALPLSKRSYPDS